MNFCIFIKNSSTFVSKRSLEISSFSFWSKKKNSLVRVEKLICHVICCRVETKFYENFGGALCTEFIVGLEPVSIVHYTRLWPVSSSPSQTNWQNNTMYIKVMFTQKVATKSWIQHQAALNKNLHCNSTRFIHVLSNTDPESPVYKLNSYFNIITFFIRIVGIIWINLQLFYFFVSEPSMFGGCCNLSLLFITTWDFSVFKKLIVKDLL